MHLATVNFEADSLNGDAGAFIHDQTCEAYSAGDGERASLLVVRLGIKGYIQTALALFGKVVVRHFAHRQLVGTLLVAPVGQFLYDVESGLVSHAAAALGGVGAVAVLRCRNADTCHTRTIGKAHIALHLTCLNAVAGNDVGLCGVQTLAVVD